MNIRNFEFKAKVDAIEKYEQKLLTLNPKYIGIDHQIDTYFNTKQGRLKLREGNIENALIDYDREDILGAKESQVILYKHVPNIALKNILAKQFGIKVVVDKQRKIYFIENVKFHFDVVKNLGAFIEVEAIGEEGDYDIDKLKSQCDRYLQFFDLTEKNIIKQSYSDLILQNSCTN